MSGKKGRSGKKPRVPNAEYANVSLKMTKQGVEKLRKMASESGMNVSEYIRRKLDVE